MSKGTAVIIGVGDGVSASLARLLRLEGYDLYLAARNMEKLSGLAYETNAQLIDCEASDAKSVKTLFEQIKNPLKVAVYNPSARQRGSIAELDPETVRKAIEVTAFGSFLMGHEASKKMLAQEIEDDVRGTILFTGASAGVKGFAQSAPFAMGKFAQRGLAQSMSRELHPKGIHVAWINIDGAIHNESRYGSKTEMDIPDSMLDPDAIAQSYLQLMNQHRSTWSEELTIRPWVESF